jgi:hypothetical protein
MKKKILSLGLVFAFCASMSVSAANPGYLDPSCETCWKPAVEVKAIGTCMSSYYPSCNATLRFYKCSVNPSGHNGTYLCDVGHYGIY